MSARTIQAPPSNTTLTIDNIVTTNLTLSQSLTIDGPLDVTGSITADSGDIATLTVTSIESTAGGNTAPIECNSNLTLASSTLSAVDVIATNSVTAAALSVDGQSTFGISVNSGSGITMDASLVIGRNITGGNDEFDIIAYNPTGNASGLSSLNFYAPAGTTETTTIDLDNAIPLIELYPTGVVVPAPASQTTGNVLTLATPTVAGNILYGVSYSNNQLGEGVSQYFNYNFPGTTGAFLSTPVGAIVTAFTSNPYPGPYPILTCTVMDIALNTIGFVCANSSATVTIDLQFSVMVMF